MFKRQNFCHIASNNRNNVKVGVFVYRTTDDVTTVTTSGYFNERIIDINLHDLIIHEQINIADTTIVERNVLCVIRRTADNVETKVIKSNWEVQIEQAIDNINQQLANLALSDLADVTISSPTVGQYLRWNGVEWINMDGDGGGGSGVWGAITGDINDQADLQAEFSAIDSNKANVDLDNLSATGQAKFDAKANVDMDNLTSVGQNIANWSSNVTNCITEIAQDIKLELDINTHTLTLKAGSKIYVPNGFESDNVTPKFDIIITTSDIVVTTPANTYTGATNIYLASDGTTTRVGINNISGTTPAADCVIYNLTTNTIKSYISGVEQPLNNSFPIAIVNRTNGLYDSINQIFNGFGYIGTATFVLPGVKGLIPDGRNPDGTCKSIELSITDVKVHELIYNAEVSHYCILQPNGLYGYGAESIFVSDTRPLPTTDFPTYAFWYDVPNNYIWTTNDNGVTWNLVNNGIFVGSMQKPSTGNIENLNPNQVFKAIDRSDIIDLLEMIYPVGAIYTTTVNSTECPMRLVIPGSKWQLVATDRALWGGNGSNAATTIAAGLPDGRGAFTESGANVTSVGGGMHKASSYSAGWGSTGGDNTATVEYRNSWWNSIYGSSTTVQPPAYRVNVWRRTA